MLVSVSCTVQFKQLSICTDECTVLYSLAQVHVSNQMMDLQYSQINDVKLRAIQISGHECQTHNCQHNSINIGVKLETEKLALIMILPDIWGIGYRGRCL